MLYGKHSELLEEKGGIAQEKLKDAKPIIAISLKEGVLIFAVNPNLKVNKIYPLHDRIACVISGHRPDFKKIYTPLRITIQDWADYYSEGDIVLKKLAEELASFIKDRYENPGVPTPYIINMALIEVAPAQKDDILIQVDFKGNLVDFNSYLILNDDESKKSKIEELIKKYLKEGYSIEKICSDVAKQNKKLHRANEGRLEAVLLSRKKVLEKKFDDVFQRLVL